MRRSFAGWSSIVATLVIVALLVTGTLAVEFRGNAGDVSSRDAATRSVDDVSARGLNSRAITSRKDAKTQSFGEGDNGRTGEGGKGREGAVEEKTSIQTFSSSTASTDLLPPPGVTHTFTNPTPINIPIGGTASVYPSIINVSNIPTELAKVTVTINDLNHTAPQDLDILLVGPQGQTAIIMSDAGGASDIVHGNITLDDEAGVVLPLNDPIMSGAYQPVNGTAGGGDSWPAPAPVSPGIGSALTVFNSTNPNGEWRLFVFDDFAIDSGSIDMGWTLTITSAFSGQNLTSIAIPDNGMASPYPSEINIAGHDAPVSSVRVTLFNFSHSSPDDVDILLASPSGRAVVLMSDVGGSTAVNNVTLTLDDNAVLALPDNGPLFGGTYRIANYDPGDGFPAPAPALTGSRMSSFNGTVANGAWKLFVVDDAGNNVGSVSGGWTILIGTSESAVSFAGAGVAAPYPSTVNVFGVPGNLTRVTVSIRDFSHTVPDDADILLVGPGGRSVVLMSDAGGAAEVGNLILTFDDLAPSQLPDGAPLTSGVYRPTDHEPGETFPPPAPAGGPTGNSLQTFYGGVPNGVWRLYVLNDNGGSIGSIVGNWDLTLYTSESACLVHVLPLIQAFPVGGGGGSFGVTQSAGCVWTATTTDSFISILSGSSGAGDGAVSFSVAPNQGPPRTGTIDVSNGVATTSFQVQQASGCPFSVNQSTVNFVASGGTGNVNVSAGGGCSWQGTTVASWIQITSQPQTGGGTLAFTVQPNPSRIPRSATINIGSQIINVNQAGVRTAPFDFNGDGRTDVSIFRPSNGTWWIAASGGGTTAAQFGIFTDKIVPADYDGDLKTDIAVYRDGTWYVWKSSDGTFLINTWGTSSDIPVPADYNADGTAELAVYRPSTGAWWILNSNGTFSAVPFGLSTDVPTPGDYDGDGRADLSVYRGGASGTWWILNSSNGVIQQYTFGIQGDIPVAADYDGDGRDNVAVFRPSTATWYRSTNPATNYDAVQWGIGSDQITPGDYDGDGRVDAAVFRNGVWYVLGSTSGTQITQFGIPGDNAVPSAYVR